MHGQLRTVVMVAALVIAPFAAVSLADDGVAEPSADVERSISSNRACGETLTVGLNLDWGDAEVLAVEEDYPDGWHVKNASHGGKETNESKLKWFQFDREVKRLSYRIEVPSGTTGPAEFFGAYRDDTMESEEDSGVVSGPSNISISCLPADAGSVTRDMPTEVTCGETVEISLSVDAPEDNEAWILDEDPPVDPGDVDQRDYGEPSQGHVKWVATEGGSGERSYNVTIPTDIEDGTTYIFRGEYRFHPSMGSRAQVDGPTTMTASCDTELEEQSEEVEETSKTTAELPDPEVTVDGTEREAAPADSLGAYTANLDADAGQGVSVGLQDEVLPSVDFYPGEPLEDATLNVTVWPFADASGNLTELPRGVQPAYATEITLSGGSNPSGHMAVLHVQLPGEDVPGSPSKSVLLHEEPGGWSGVGSLSLSPAPGGGYEGSVQTPCCSMFVMGFDLIGPTVELTEDLSSPGEVELAADASDNVGLSHVAFLVDGETVARDAQAPYTTQLDEEDFEPGEHEVQAVAVDWAGSEASAETQAAFGTDSGLGLGAWAALLVGLVAIVGVGFETRRRGGVDATIEDVRDHLEGIADLRIDRSATSPADGGGDVLAEADVEEVPPADPEPADAETEDPDQVIAAFQEVPGIGASKAAAIYEAGFESMADLHAATPEELTQAKGVGDKLAGRIVEELDERTDASPRAGPNGDDGPVEELDEEFLGDVQPSNET